MQALPQAAFLLLLEAAVGGTIALFWVHLRGAVTVGFTLFTGVCFFVFGGLAVWLRSAFPPLAATEADPTAALWFAVERTFSIAFVVLLGLYLVGLRVRRGEGRGKASVPQNGAVHLARPASGGTNSLVDFAALVGQVGPLVPLLGLASLWAAALVSPTPQIFGLGSPLAVLAGAMALGSALAGLSLGHWYLVSPTLSVRPLIELTFVCLGALVAQIVLVPLLLLLPGQQPTRLGLLFTDYLVFLGVRVVFGLLVPLVATLMTWRTARIRSLDSATGLLYVVAALILAGEIAARTLLFLTGVAT